MAVAAAAAAAEEEQEEDRDVGEESGGVVVVFGATAATADEEEEDGEEEKGALSRRLRNMLAGRLAGWMWMWGSSTEQRGEQRSAAAAEFPCPLALRLLARSPLGCYDCDGLERGRMSHSIDVQG
jgi:hypothetical protein